MIESALPFIAFTIAWVAARQLYPAIAAAVITAALLAIIRLVQRQSIKYVVQAVIPTVDRRADRNAYWAGPRHLLAGHSV